MLRIDESSGATTREAPYFVVGNFGRAGLGWLETPMVAGLNGIRLATVLVLATLGHCAALHATIRRYVTGIDVSSPDLDANRETTTNSTYGSATGRPASWTPDRSRNVFGHGQRRRPGIVAVKMDNIHSREE